jgi:PAS domain S-box-containing protein
VIVISGDDGRLGIIVHTNNSVRSLIGYKRSELL